jgi:hypothetical protein
MAGSVIITDLLLHSSVWVTAVSFMMLFLKIKEERTQILLLFLASKCCSGHITCGRVLVINELPAPWRRCIRAEVRRQRKLSKDITTYEPHTLLWFSLALLSICDRAVLTKPVRLLETYSIRFIPSDIRVSASIPFSLSYSQTIPFHLLFYNISLKATHSLGYLFIGVRQC